MRRAWSAVALGLVVVLGSAGCSGGGGKAGASGRPTATVAGASTVASPATPSPPPVLSVTPAKGATDVRPDQQVEVSADHGSITSVQVRSAGGDVVEGEVDPAGGSWHSSMPLTGGTTYTVTADASTPDGAKSSVTSSFSTIKPSATMSATLIPGDNWTVGVGMPVIVQFARAVKNKAATVKALSVTTTPRQLDGAWHWMNDQSVWWRPRDFWPAGTKVKVTAAIDGAELASGVWGRRTYTANFTIGDSHIYTVDVTGHTLTVTNGGSVVRVIPVTTGRDTPKFRTRGGTKVIMEKAETVMMDARTTGTLPGDPDFYQTVEHWTMRLTWSGEYLHARPGSDWAFGKANISHGCTGMSNSNAHWLFDYSQIGDVVKYVNSSRALEFGNGYTAWDMTFEQWAQPSA